MDLHSRLLTIESGILSARLAGIHAVEAFGQSFLRLQADIDHALRTSDIDDRTKALAYATSSNVSIISDALIDLDFKSEEITMRLKTEMEDILDALPSSDQSIAIDSSNTQSASMSGEDKRHPCPPYIASAYKWLRHNIYKPYPTVDEIKSICANSDTSEKRIRNWFISARRRMGWAKIAKEYFHSDREDTADAAYRALVEPDPKRPIEAKLMFEFVKMEVAAEGMYSSAFKPSQFAGSLGTTVVGMSTEHKACIEQMRQQAIEEENIRKQVEHQMKKQRVTKRNGSQRQLVPLYPSPERSSCSSPEPTLALSETEEDETIISLLNVAAGQKRSRSSSFDTLDSHADKRLRSATATSQLDPSTSLPSPSARAEAHILDYLTSSNVSPIDPKAFTHSSPASRKRPLSDADACGAQKRPRGLDAGPRLQTVSDPLSMSRATMQALELQNWNMSNFEFNFELPGTVTSQPLDPSVPIDVEFFDWTNDLTFANDSFPPSPSSLCPIAPQQIDQPAGGGFDQFLRDMLSQSTESQVRDTLTLSQTPLVLQVATESMGAASHDWSAYVDSVPSAQDPVIVDSFGQPYGFIDLSAIPNFDPSMLKPPSPPSPADIIAQSEAVTKQSKLQQCYAHFEAARNYDWE